MKNLVILILTFLFVLSSVNRVCSQDSVYVLATLLGEKTGDQLELVSKAGDVNGDGFDDVFVCSIYGHYAKLYLGGSPFDTTADLRFSASNIAGAGDVNNDGFDDILVKTYVEGTIFPKGRILLYLGESPMDTIPDFEFTEPWIQDELGSSMAGVGDVNGDNYNDFLIGSAYNWSDGMGRAYLFLGSENINNIPFVRFLGDTVGNFFGGAVCGIGDINNDQFSDIIIGAPSYDFPSDDSGRVMLNFGSNQMDSIPDRIFRENDFCFGSELHNAGDINQDDMSEFIITSDGYAYIYSGLDTCIAINIRKWGYKENSGNPRVGTGGDINNDGHNDLILGNPNYTNELNEMVGIAHVFLGGKILDTFPDLTLTGGTHWGEFSKNMSIIGDINNDGYEEFAIAERGFPNYENPLGKITIYSLNKLNEIDKYKDLYPQNGFRLYQNYPNPFNLETKIRYSVPSKCLVFIEIYNSNGQKIRTLINAEQSQGEHELIWNGSNDEAQLVSSGIYFVKMTTSIPRFKTQNNYEIKKIIMLK